MSACCCSPGSSSPPRWTPRPSASFPASSNSIIGRLVLFGFTWALFHHLLGGVRHFIWDAGYGMDAPEREQLAWATLIGGFVLTIVVWAIGYAVR